MSLRRLCRAADKRQRRKPIDPHLAKLRELMADDVSLAEVWYELNSAHIRARAASATVEALMYSLRERGTKALTERDTQRRIGELSEEQLHAAGARLQRLARAWSAEEIERLAAAWMAHHAG
jgi:hypothetical protein